MLALLTFFLTALVNTVAQMPPPQGPPPQYPPAGSMQPLEDGPCLDSSRSVPRVIAAPVSRAMQIVRIDQVLSTATMMPGEIIGFLYTTQDGSTWLGERTAQYLSPADATAINEVLASTHLPSQTVNDFPPQSRYGVPTKLPRLFKVLIPPDAMAALHIQLAPCIVWPPGRPLPDPSM
jgi:hypothetical protein